MKRLGKAFAAILFAGFLFANIAVASAIPLANTNIRTVDEIRAKWTLDKPVYSGSAFLVNPGVTAPYSTGVLQPGYMQDALDKTNFARYLVGLPDDVTLDAAYTDEVQHSAVVLAGIGGSLTHYPVKPADMSQAFFDLGYAGTTSSNIAAGDMTLHLTVDAYLSDAGDTNIAVVGHRRWILNPSLAKTGFGWAKKTGSLYNTYSAMHAFDRSRSDVVTYTSYGWPAAGPFPREFFPTGTPWSIHLDTFDYDYDMIGVTVTLTRVGDGVSWTFNSADNTADTSGSGEYFNIDNSGYGSPACIIFRPPLSLHYNVGDAFDVRVSGKLYTKGTTNPVQLNYRTTFFDLVRPNTAPVAVNDIAVVAQNGQLSVAIPGVLLNDTDGEADVLTVRLASGVSHGTLLLDSDGSYTYRPDSGYYGTDTFYYYANDGTVNSNMGRVTITVVRGNSVPLAIADSGSCAVNGVLSVPAPGVLANDSDSAGNMLSAELVASSTHGELVFVSDGSYRYIPAAGYVGDDSFSYRAFDGSTYSATVPVTITVTAGFTISLPKATVYTPHAPSTMSHSRYYTIYGYLKPRHTSGSYPVRIYKYRLVSGHWKSYGYESARATNYYSFTKYSHSIKLPYTGKWKIRAYAPADSGHSATWSSGSDYVTVK